MLPLKQTNSNHPSRPNQEMRRGSNFIFAHSQGSHFAYYVTKLLRSNYNVNVKALSESFSETSLDNVFACFCCVGQYTTLRLEGETLGIMV